MRRLRNILERFAPESLASVHREIAQRDEAPSEGEAPGLSVFLRDGEDLYHTYSTYLRGLDPFITTYALFDHTPLGRQEGPDCPPMSWVRYHDDYADRRVSM